MTAKVDPTEVTRLAPMTPADEGHGEPEALQAVLMDDSAVLDEQGLQVPQVVAEAVVDPAEARVSPGHSVLR